jgi:Na+/melibiose symporter-like transporter
MSLGLAAGLALPLAQWLGYSPGAVTAAGSELQGLLICYAFLPCGVKLAAILLLQSFSTADSAGD